MSMTMKHIYFTSLLTILFLMVGSKAFAYNYNAEIDGIYYEFSGTEATVTYGNNSYSGDIVIPSCVDHDGNTYEVTSIGDAAFFDDSSLTSIKIPESITTIGGSAFGRCTALTSITIPNSVTSIGAKAFWLCDGLTSITIPNSVTSIGDGAFYDCDGLTSITISNSVTSIGSSAFNSCRNLTSITIPNSVTSIGEYNQEIKGKTNVEIIPISA